MFTRKTVLHNLRHNIVSGGTHMHPLQKGDINYHLRTNEHISSTMLQEFDICHGKGKFLDPDVQFDAGTLTIVRLVTRRT